jgi:serine/threonine protein kinase
MARREATSMSTFEHDQWRKLAPYLDRGLELSPEARAAWLEDLRQSEPAVAGEVQRLLTLHEAADRDAFLDSASSLAPPRLRQPGEVVGAYTLVSHIGRGGMGSVWRATRGDGRFERDVAIKFLNIALADHGAARFRREGRILGRLSHPNIAQLLDAGTTPGGEAYLVLELVEGRPLDEHCETGRLPVSARVRVFLQVLDAVAFAHANLVVHRDLKPANVLVDSDGQVKLLDFGIAKLLDRGGEAAPATELTRDGGPALTLAYAAPEQVSGGPVTTATDVYALGVLLYQVLTGRHPAQHALGSYAETVHAILEAEPAPPSQAAPERLRGALRGDLDTIVGTAVKKAPAERYASATAFAEDLRRALRDEPIAARPDSVGYRARKFARRNALGLAVVAIIVSALSVGLYVANRERANAERRFAQVRQLANRFIQLDEEIRELPGSTRARNRIVSESLRYLQGLGEEAGHDPALALEIGNAYRQLGRVQGVPFLPNLGQFREAEDTFGRAAHWLDRVLEADAGNREALLASAGVAHDRMTVLDYQRRTEEALAQARLAGGRLEAFVASGTASEEEVSTVAHLYSNLGVAYVNNDRLADAAHYARRAAEVAAGVPAAAVRRASALGVLSMVQRYRGELDAALAAARESRLILEGLSPTLGTSQAGNLVNAFEREAIVLGSASEIGLGRTEEALATFQRAMALAEAAAARDPNDERSRRRIGELSLEVGDILLSTDPARALAVYERALRVIKETPGTRQARLEAGLLLGTSYGLRRLGRGAEAARRIDLALGLLRNEGLHPQETIEPLSEADFALRALADHRADAGQIDEAVELYRQLVTRLRAGQLRQDEDLRGAAAISRAWSGLSDVLRRGGRPDDAALVDADRRALWAAWVARRPAEGAFRRQLELATTGATDPLSTR